MSKFDDHTNTDGPHPDSKRTESAKARTKARRNQRRAKAIITGRGR